MLRALRRIGTPSCADPDFALNTWIRQEAAATGAVYLDLHTPMSDARQGMRAQLSGDGVHPNAAGFALMAPHTPRAIEAALRR